MREADAALAAEIEAYGARAARGATAAARAPRCPAPPTRATLYKALGLDPTKTRPSNEALLRRVLKGEALYRVNTLVDALNLCSLRAQLPFGLYDLDRVRPPVVLRRGAAGEGYEGIRKARGERGGPPGAGRRAGPFGNPTSDSARTMITLETPRAPRHRLRAGLLRGPALEQVLDETEALLTRHCGGTVRRDGASCS